MLPPAETDRVAEQPPRIIEPDPDSTALVNHESAYRDGAGETGAGPSAQNPAPPAKASEAPLGRWWPLTGALLTLFVSMGGNAYLGMQWWSARKRCQELIKQLRSPRQGIAHERLETDPEELDDTDEDQDVRIVNEHRQR